MVEDKKIDFPVYIANLQKEIEPIKNDLIIQCQKDKHSRLKHDNNFYVNTNHKDFIYNLFIEKASSFLKKFTIINFDFKVWCYLTDESFNRVNWHNHAASSTVSGVLYLKTVSNSGIVFEEEQTYLTVHPKDFDLLIFPNYLNHLPILSSNDLRVSLALEFTCHENSRDIFY